MAILYLPYGNILWIDAYIQGRYALQVAGLSLVPHDIGKHAIVQGIEDIWAMGGDDHTMVLTMI